MEFKFSWDGHSMSQFVNFHGYSTYMQDLLGDISESYGKEGVSRIKPHVKASGKWPGKTGQTAKGITYEVDLKVGKSTTHFLGTHKAETGRGKPRNIAHMLDVGNFRGVMFSNSYGYRSFPISGRTGQVEHRFTKIQGAEGRYFSETVREELLNGTPSLIEKAVQDFLDRLVI